MSEYLQIPIRRDITIMANQHRKKLIAEDRPAAAVGSLRALPRDLSGLIDVENIVL